MVGSEIEKIDIKSLVPAEYNPRKISEKDYTNLKNSIDEFGIVSPIIINLSDNTIISGHQRFDILYYENDIQELNLIRLGDIGWVFTETDLKIKDKNYEKTLNLALNRVHGEWDEDKLNNVLIELESVNLDYLTGFDLEFDDINYEFISRVDDDEYEEESYESEVYEDEIYDELEDEHLDEKIEQDFKEYQEKQKEKEEKKQEELNRIRRGFIKYGDVYKIGDSSYLMFGKENNEQDRTKLLNINSKAITLPDNLKKIKTINKEINYYISDDAELIENIIINNKSYSKKIS